MNREKGEGVPDFVLMNELTEDALMENLTTRYKKGRIYTYIGEVVVSVNPYKAMDELYSKKKMEEYKGSIMYEVPPHIYSLSNEVYRQMLSTKENQCVIISGESGAGKTEASKILMQYIAFVSKSSAYNADVHDIKEKLLESNPILEAFGNAKTLRNNNSSRFGKYMEIQFEPDGTPIGGKITNYLLEKSRIVIRANGERSFHIFYQLLSGATPDQLQKLKLSKDPLAYNYLKSSECTTVDSIPDAADFKSVNKAMDVLSFSADSKNSIWRLLAAVLRLGNITFKDENLPKTKVSVDNKQELDLAAELLDLPSEILFKCITARTITTGPNKRGSSIIIPLDLQQANFTRDALAKTIYQLVFNWLITKINSQIESKKKKTVYQSIGLLDIYGFEIFENNSFEQFCINLCNEKLQQLFIELTLKSEQEEYVREGIAWEPVKYFNNKIICELIEGKGGIISLMDECILIAESTDETLLARMDQNFGKHAHYQSYRTSQDRKIPDNSFRLKHYAGDVTYNTTGILEKCKDTLFIDLVLGMQSSNNKLLQELFNPIDTSSKKRPVTSATQFKNSLVVLIETLLACQPHYIRCIKPNEEKKAGVLDLERVRHQVRYLGLLENVRVRRAGFAYRQLYEKFVHRYKMVCKETWPNSGKNARQDTEMILKSHNIKPAEYQFGKTKIFLRNPTTLFYFEEQREKHLPRVATLMQSAWRGFVARTQVKKIRGAYKIQAVWKGYQVRKELVTLKEKLRKQKAATKMVAYYARFRVARWLKLLAKTYRDFMKEKMYGKYIAWPQHPKIGNTDSLKELAATLRKVYAKWRAVKMVKSLNKDEQLEMRQKVLGYTIFSGKKPWDCARRYEADYLSMPSNPKKDKFIEGMERVFATYNEQEILFADYTNKVNRHAKSQRRAIVITEKSVYKQDPDNYKVRKKTELALSQIDYISLSKERDTFVFVHAKPPSRDLVLDLGVNGGEKASEFVVVLVGQVKQLTDQDIRVEFSANIPYNNSRGEKSKGTDCTCSFQEAKDDPKLQPGTCKFKAGKNNAHSVLFK